MFDTRVRDDNLAVGAHVSARADPALGGGGGACTTLSPPRAASSHRCRVAGNSIGDEGIGAIAGLLRANAAVHTIGLRGDRPPPHPHPPIPRVPTFQRFNVNELSQLLFVLICHWLLMLHDVQRLSTLTDRPEFFETAGVSFFVSI